MNKKIKEISLYIYLGIMAILWVLMTASDGFGWGWNTTWSKYSAVILSFVMSLINFKKYRSHYFVGAMLFTLISDLFLCVLMSYGVSNVINIALVTFIIAQMFHGVNVNEYRKLWITGIARLVIFGLLLILVLNVNGVNLTSFLVCLYFANLVMNMLDSFIHKSKGHILFGIAFILFIGCDICVGWQSSTLLGQPGAFFNWFDRFSVIGMWLFYMPCIALLTYANYWRYKDEN